MLSGNTTIGGTLGVTGDSTFFGNGVTTFNGGLDVHQLSLLRGGLQIGNPGDDVLLEVHGMTWLHGAVTIGILGTEYTFPTSASLLDGQALVTTSGGNTTVWGAVTSNGIANDVVTTAKIENGTITTDDFASSIYGGTAGNYGTAATVARSDHLHDYLDGTGSANGVCVWSDANTVSYDSNLYWDSTNDRLGISSTSPSYDLSFGSEANRTIAIERSASGAGKNLTIQAGGAQSEASSTIGGTLILSSGPSNRCAGSDVELQTYYGGGSCNGSAAPSETRMKIVGDGSIKFKPPVTEGGNWHGMIITDSMADTANTMLDVKGDFAIRRSGFTASNDANSGINIGHSSFVKISGPTAAFSITSISASDSVDGKVVVLYNSTDQNMTITNEGAGDAKILTLTGLDIVTTGTGAVTLIYDSDAGRWIVTALQP